jgi:cytochrome P450
MAIDPHQLLDPHVVQDPYPFYDEVRREAPVWRVGGSNVFLVTAFEPLAEAALRVNDFSSVLTALLYKDADGLPATLPIELGEPTLATADPPVHTLHKQLMFPRFVTKRMELLEEELVGFTNARLDETETHADFDFMTAVAGAVPIHAISALIGFRNSDEQMLLQTAYDSVELTGGFKTLEELGRARLRTDEISAWMNAQLDERDGRSATDVLDAVKAAINGGQLTKGEGVTTMLTLLAAGGESTASLLGAAVRILADRPDIQAVLQKDLALLPAFIDEALRLESPFRHHLRSVPRDTELAGVPVPAGSAVMLMWGAANRDPAVFENPAELVLGRPQQHVTFGRGIHQCLGRALARLEARIVLTAMLQRQRFPKVVADQEPEWEYSLQVRRYRRLPLTWN